jgi:putative transposase
LWTERRKVSKVGTVTMHNNTYEVDHGLAGRYVELAFDPFDLTRIEVRHAGKIAGIAVPFVIGRHSHPKARPERPGTDQQGPPRTLTAIDYLHLIDEQHHAQRHKPINYSALLDTRDPADQPVGDQPPARHVEQEESR